VRETSSRASSDKKAEFVLSHVIGRPATWLAGWDSARAKRSICWWAFSENSSGIGSPGSLSASAQISVVRRHPSSHRCLSRDRVEAAALRQRRVGTRNAVAFSAANVLWWASVRAGGLWLQPEISPPNTSEKACQSGSFSLTLIPSDNQPSSMVVTSLEGEDVVASTGEAARAKLRAEVFDSLYCGHESP